MTEKGLIYHKAVPVYKYGPTDVKVYAKVFTISLAGSEVEVNMDREDGDGVMLFGASVYTLRDIVGPYTISIKLADGHYRKKMVVISICTEDGKDFSVKVFPTRNEKDAMAKAL